MSGESKQRKAEFIRLMMSSIEHTSCNKDNAREYLIEEGIASQAVRFEGLKRIKKLQLQAKANKMKNELASTESIKQKAIALVEKILTDINFSFPQFVRNENLVLQNRNLESLTKEDIKSTLTQFYYLKLLDQENKRSNEL